MGPRTYSIQRPPEVLQVSRVFGRFHDKHACECYDIGTSQTADMTSGRNHTPGCRVWMEKADVNPKEFEVAYSAREARIREKVKTINAVLDKAYTTHAILFGLNVRGDRLDSAYTKEGWDRYEGDGRMPPLRDMIRALLMSIRQVLARS